MKHKKCWHNTTRKIEKSLKTEELLEISRHHLCKVADLLKGPCVLERSQQVPLLDTSKGIARNYGYHEALVRNCML